MREPDAPVWVSAHLFLAGHIYRAPCDRVLEQVVEPVVRHCTAAARVDRWFFIRYRELGSHVRLRLHTPEPARIRTELEREVRARFPRVDVAEGPVPVAAPERGTDPSQVVALRWITYEPEIERYGGPHGVALAEEIFHCSSEAALGLLRRIDPEQRAARLGRGLLAMTVLLHAFFRSRATAAAMAEGYGTNYLRMIAREAERRSTWEEAFDRSFEQQSERLVEYVGASWDCLRAGEPLFPELDAYIRGLVPLRARFREAAESDRLMRGSTPLAGDAAAASALVPSYLHMMNNRLGISVPEESYLACILHRALAANLTPSRTPYARPA